VAGWKKKSKMARQSFDEKGAKLEEEKCGLEGQAWKRKVLEELPGIFSQKRERDDSEARRREDELYRQIGQLTVELDWVKKKSALLS
jgi:hypothetical protein